LGNSGVAYTDVVTQMSVEKRVSPMSGQPYSVAKFAYQRRLESQEVERIREYGLILKMVLTPEPRQSTESTETDADRIAWGEN
jgi:membrane-bound lytic murein transglycosylase MltF